MPENIEFIENQEPLKEVKPVTESPYEKKAATSAFKMEDLAKTLSSEPQHFDEIPDDEILDPSPGATNPETREEFLIEAEALVGVFDFGATFFAMLLAQNKDFEKYYGAIPQEKRRLFVKNWALFLEKSQKHFPLEYALIFAGLTTYGPQLVGAYMEGKEKKKTVYSSPKPEDRPNEG